MVANGCSARQVGVARHIQRAAQRRVAAHAEVIGHVDVIAQADLHLAVGHRGDHVGIRAYHFHGFAQLLLHCLAVAGLQRKTLVGEFLLLAGELADVDGIRCVDAGRHVGNGLAARIDAGGRHAGAIGNDQPRVAQRHVRAHRHARVIDHRIACLDAARRA